MAKNWTMAEAAEAVINNDKVGICDLGKRFPNVAVALAKMGNNEGAMTIINALPEYVTARKVEAVLKGDVDTSAEGDDDSDDEEEDAPSLTMQRRKLQGRELERGVRHVRQQQRRQ